MTVRSFILADSSSQNEWTRAKLTIPVGSDSDDSDASGDDDDDESGEDWDELERKAKKCEFFRSGPLPFLWCSHTAEHTYT